MNPVAADLHALFAFAPMRLLDRLNRNRIQMRTTLGTHERLCDDIALADALRRDARLIWIPATAIPPSPTAAAQRFTDPERTSPAAKIPGRLVSSGAGRRLFARHAGASATSAPVLMNPFSSRSISGGSHSVHGRAPIIENTAGVLIVPRSSVRVFSNSTSSSFWSPNIFRISVR